MLQSATHKIELIITTELTGRAIRLVNRKYFGKVWNLTQHRGAVKSWQLIDIAAASQTFFTGHSVPSTSGYQEESDGYNNAIPSMARYES